MIQLAAETNKNRAEMDLHWIVRLSPFVFTVTVGGDEFCLATLLEGPDCRPILAGLYTESACAHKIKIQTGTQAALSSACTQYQFALNKIK